MDCRKDGSDRPSLRGSSFVMRGWLFPVLWLYCVLARCQTRDASLNSDSCDSMRGPSDAQEGIAIRCQGFAGLIWLALLACLDADSWFSARSDSIMPRVIVMHVTQTFSRPRSSPCSFQPAMIMMFARNSPDLSRIPSSSYTRQPHWCSND